KVFAVVVLLLVMTLGAGGAFYWRSGLHPVEQQASIKDRALAAYQAGNYKEAQGLFREWAISVKDDKRALGVVMIYVEDITERLAAPTSKAPLEFSKVMAN